VLGGGLAGMTAALRLAERGYGVTLVERRPYLGGRAYSFVDRETGAEIDNGQHVFLGCCTAYVELLRDIGSLERTSTQRRLRIEVRGADGKRGLLAGLPLPAPLHLLSSFARYPHIGWRDKLRAVPALLRIQRERDRNREALRRISFGDWLRANGQSAGAIANFWELVALPSLNDGVDDVSASMAFMLFQTALLTKADGANVGFARTGLSDVMGGPMADRLRALGAEVVLGRTVEAIDVDDGVVRGVRLAGGETLPCDAVVSALPPDMMLDLLPDDVRTSDAFALASTHTWAPIVNLHVWYDRPVADFEFTAFVGSPVQWVFNKTRIASLVGPGEYLTVSLSGAWAYWPITKEELRALFIPELAHLLPAAVGATVERFVVVKEQRATFRSLPDGPANRLGATTPVAGLVLAGDWTDTGWPATMESAVRSGNAAADALSQLGKRPS
jgi:squalene-associated FAD-dependent desaturase